MRRIIFTVLLLLAAGGGVVFADDNITVGKAVELLFKNNPAIKQAEGAVKASTARVGQRRSGYMPTINLEGTYTNLQPDPSFVFPGLGLIQFFPENNYDAHIGLTQTLFDFGRVSSSLGAAKYNLSMARDNLELVKANYAFETIRVFYSILLLKQSIIVQQQQIDSLNEALDMATKKVASGTATNFDELTTRVKVAEAQSQKIELDNMLRKQRITLGRLMGTGDSDSFDITGEFMGASSAAVDERALIDQALKNRLELIIAKDSENSAKSQLSASKADNYPSIRGFFSYGYKNGYFPGLDDIKQNTVAGGQVEFPLFNGLKTSNQVKEAGANFDSARQRTREIRDTVVSEVRQAVSEVRAALEKIKATELNEKLAEEAVKQAKVRYRSGVITNLDLLNAETSLAQAHLSRLQALYNYTLSTEALKKAVGAGLL
jgi:outer membrane protein TolC